jgi:hypothetical protein
LPKTTPEGGAVLVDCTTEGHRGNTEVAEVRGAKAFDVRRRSSVPDLCGPLWSSVVNLSDGDTTKPEGGAVFVAFGVRQRSSVPVLCEPLWTSVVNLCDGDTTRPEGGAVFVAFGVRQRSSVPDLCEPLWTSVVNLLDGDTMRCATP